MTGLPHDAALQAAAAALGWHGQLTGPVNFGGVRFHAVLDGDTLRGCLVPARAREVDVTVAEASLLAAYTARAVVVDAAASAHEVLYAQVDAAVLDIGLVVVGESGAKALTRPGPCRGPVGAPSERTLRFRRAIAGGARKAPA